MPHALRIYPNENEVGKSQAQVGKIGGQVGKNGPQVGKNVGQVGTNWGLEKRETHCSQRLRFFKRKFSLN
jgi:hypothetical protein